MSPSKLVSSVTEAMLDESHTAAVANELTKEKVAAF